MSEGRIGSCCGDLVSVCTNWVLRTALCAVTARRERWAPRGDAVGDWACKGHFDLIESCEGGGVFAARFFRDGLNSRVGLACALLISLLYL